MTVTVLGTLDWDTDLPYSSASMDVPKSGYAYEFVATLGINYAGIASFLKTSTTEPQQNIAIYFAETPDGDPIINAPASINWGEQWRNRTWSGYAYLRPLQTYYLVFKQTTYGYMPDGGWPAFTGTLEISRGIAIYNGSDKADQVWPNVTTAVPDLTTILRIQNSPDVWSIGITTDAVITRKGKFTAIWNNGLGFAWPDSSSTTAIRGWISATPGGAALAESISGTTIGDHKAEIAWTQDPADPNTNRLYLAAASTFYFNLENSSPPFTDAISNIDFISSSDDTVTTPDEDPDIEGLKVRGPNGWVNLLPVYLGYGGIDLDNAAQSDTVLNTWQDAVGWDAITLSSPRFVTQDFTNGGLKFSHAGVWQVSLTLTVFHNEVNAGRILGMRLHETTVPFTGTNKYFGTGRNVNVTNMAVTTLVDIPDTLVGKLIEVQIGGVDVYTSVVIESGSFQATYLDITSNGA